MFSNFNARITCALSVIIFATATPALAGTSPVTVTAPSEDTRSTIVVYGDLDLAIARDRKRLDRRVGGAIEDVCGFREYQSVRMITARAPYLACSDAAWSRARAAMKSAIALAQRGAGASGVQIADKAVTVWARSED